MSHIASYWAIEQRGISPTAKLVLMVLADYHNSETGGCYPSKAALAEKCCCSERTIVNATQELALAGLITLVSRQDEFGRQRSNQYMLNIQLGEGANLSRGRVKETTPLEQVIYNQDTIPSELEDPVLSIFANHEEPPESNNKTFWDEAVGMLMGMGVADVTARTFVGRCLKLANGDQAEILRVMEAALAAGVRDPIPYLSAALGGKKKKETVVKNKAIADAFAALEAESEKRKAQWAEELGEDYTGGGSKKDNEVLQPEPPIGLSDVHVKRSKSVRTVHPRRVAKIIRPVIGDRDEMQVPANDS
jgi:Helix-turn-helix domain